MQLGNWLIHWLIASEYEINSTFTILLFCLTFALSVQALELLIFEITEIDSVDTRYALWWITLGSLVVLLIVIIPALLIERILTKITSNSKAKLIIGTILTFTYISSFFYYFGISAYQLTRQMDMITKVGTVIIGILSGFGAVNCPFAYFQFISMKIEQVRSVKMEIVANIYFTLKEIEKTGIKIALLDYNYEEKVPVRNFWSFFFTQTDPQKEQRNDLKNEIKQLKVIHEDFFEFYKDYTEEENRYEFSLTWYGKFLKRLAWVVFVYCIYKMLMSTFNYIVGRQKSIDPINRVLKVILPYFGITLLQETYETLAIYSTFIFMGYLMISNVRSFSLNLVNMFNSFMGIKIVQKMPAGVLVMVLAEIFGIYLLSTLILLQTSLPDHFLNNLKQFTEPINILGHYSNFDFYFIVSGALSFLVLYFNYWKRNQRLQSFQH